MSSTPSIDTLKNMFSELARQPSPETTLNKLVNHAPVGIMLVNSKHAVDFANPTACQIMGVNPRKLDGRTLGDLFGDDYLRMRNNNHSATQDSSSENEIVEHVPHWITIKTPENKERFLKIEFTRVEDQEGDSYLCFITDVSTIHELKMELSESNTFFHNLIESSVDGIIAADMKGKIILFNRSAELILGYTREEAINSLHVSRIYPEGEAREILKRMRSNDFGGKGKLLRHELIAITKDGRQIPMSLSGGILYVRGEEIATFGIFTDLRNIQKIEQDMQQLHKMLLHSEKMAGLGRLAAGVAHEINNPMAGIMLYSNLILERLGKDNPVAEELEVIIHEAERCKQIVSDLLTFSHQTMYERCDVDINEQIHKSLAILEKQPLFHNIEVVTQLKESLNRIWGNPIRLNQVFTNIIVNAAQAMKGSGKLTILTHHRSNNELVEICIKDNGPGIDKEILPQIFDPFFTTKTEEGGTGLGLSVSYAIVKEHKGTIRAESHPDQGTTFVLRFPIYQQEVSPEES